MATLVAGAHHGSRIVFLKADGGEEPTKYSYKRAWYIAKKNNDATISEEQVYDLSNAFLNITEKNVEYDVNLTNKVLRASSAALKSNIYPKNCQYPYEADLA
jgi:hypothetical protein